MGRWTGLFEGGRQANGSQGGDGVSIRELNLAALVLAMSGLMGWGLPAAEKAVEATLMPLPETVVKGAVLEEVYSEKRFFEGPVWDPKTGKLYFTSHGSKKSARIMRLDEKGKATLWLDNSGGIGGTWVSKEGRLLATQAHDHRVVSYAFGPEGPLDLKVLHTDKDLFQPNDLCQLAVGDIYFTDPDFKEKKASAVWHLSPKGEAKKVITDMAVPNGVIASLDGKVLYVSDSHQKHWMCFPILPGGDVGKGQVFFAPETENKKDPDGMTIDARGNLYFTGRGGVWVVSPKGKALGLIPVPRFCSNVAFGGPDYKTLYLTCSQKVFSLAMNIEGGRPGKP